MADTFTEMYGEDPHKTGDQDLMHESRETKQLEEDIKAGKADASARSVLNADGTYGNGNLTVSDLLSAALANQKFELELKKIKKLARRKEKAFDWQIDGQTQLMRIKDNQLQSERIPKQALNTYMPLVFERWSIR